MMKHAAFRFPTLTLMAALMVTGGAMTAGGQAPVDSFEEVPMKSLPPPHPRMTSEFHSLVTALKGDGREGRVDKMRAAAASERAAPAFRLRGEQYEQIEAYIWLEGWSDAVKSAVEKAGAEIVAEDESRFLLQAWIPLDRIETVASVNGVRHLRRPSYAAPASGTFLSEGDSNLGGNFIRSFGQVTGQGIRVGVLSQGLFNSSFPSQTVESSGSNRDARVSSGNLPASAGGGDGPSFGFLGGVRIVPESFSLHDVRQIPEIDGNQIPEGAAILEVLHDMAPGATLEFAGVNTDVELGVRRNILLSRNVDVIVDDLVFYDSGRFDGTSTISRRAQEIALTRDIVYVVATGNYTPPPPAGTGFDAFAQTRRFPLFINGFFTPLPGFTDARFHNFAAGRDPSIGKRSLFVWSDGGLLDVILVWDDVWDDQQPRATDDLDLYLFSGGGIDSGTVVASSVDIQNNTGRPIERLTAFVGGGRHELVISRKNVSNTAPTLFSLIILQGIVEASDTVYLTHGIAGNNGDALPPVISVGSIDAVRGINNIDPQTVPGRNPGPGLANDRSFIRWYTTQTVPSVVSYSNVQNMTALFSTGAPFTGSSAAASHIGGLVTLMRNSWRDIPATAYYDLLRDETGVLTQDGVFPSASKVLAGELAEYALAPTYYRVNGFDAWSNIRDRRAMDTSRRARIAPNTAVVPWESSGRVDPFTEAEFSDTPQGLAISPGGKQNVFGYWQTPVMELQGLNGEPTKTLRTDRLYELTVRVGTDESDPTRVPDFRLRLTTGGNDESALLVVAGLDKGAANPPTTIGGKEYRLYYRPSNDGVALQGARFAFDLVHFDPTDNSDATLFLQDVQFRELPLP